MGIRLSNIDRGINTISAYNSYKNRKVSEQILVQQKKSNAELNAIKEQMKVANTTNRRILENQIKEIEHKEEQKFYKALSFNNNEIIEKLEKIEDSIVLKYLADGYYEKTKNSLTKANDVLVEINDKLFNKQILEKLNLLKGKADLNIENYKSDTLSKIDSLLVDYEQKKDKLDKLKNSHYIGESINSKKKFNLFRIVGIIILSLMTLLMTLISFMPTINGSIDFFAVFVLLAFTIPLLLLLRKEINSRKEFKKYELLKIQKAMEERNEKSLFEQKQKLEIESQENELLKHPLIVAMEEIQEKHPTFEESTKYVSDLESEFMKKWGISFETKKENPIDEKIKQLVQRGEMLNAIKVYKEENNVSLTDAKKKIDDLAILYRN